MKPSNDRDSQFLQHDTLPSFATESCGNLMLYFAGTLQVLIDDKTRRPVPFTRAMFVTKLKRFLYIFFQTGFLFSLLIPFEYHIAPPRHVGGFFELFYWGNLVNAYMIALLTSSILEGTFSLRHQSMWSRLTHETYHLVQAELLAWEC